jgi:MFS family permease
MNEDLGFSYQVLNNSYALGCGGVALGAPLLAPFTLKFGRRQIYIVSTALQFGICIWEAKLQTATDLYLVTFLSCFLGAFSEIIIQMTIADVFFIHQRGGMNSIFIFCQTIGMAVAPVIAGYITVSLGWRAVWWAMAIMLGLGLLLFIFLYEETKYVLCLMPPSFLAPAKQHVIQVLPHHVRRYSARYGTGRRDRPE